MIKSRKQKGRCKMTTATKKKSRIYDITFIAISAAIMAVCSWISIPGPVPFTLQTFGVFVTVGILEADEARWQCWYSSCLVPWAFRCLPDSPADLAFCSALPAAISWAFCLQP